MVTDFIKLSNVFKVVEGSNSNSKSDQLGLYMFKSFTYDPVSRLISSLRRLNGAKRLTVATNGFL